MSKPKKYYRKKTDNETLNTLKDNLPDILTAEDYIKSEKIIEKYFVGQSFFSMGDIPNFKFPKLKDKYVGGFINSDKGILTLGIFSDKTTRLRYSKNEKIALAYPDTNELYIVEAVITGLKGISQENIHEMPVNKNLPKEHMDNFMKMLVINRFDIMNLCIMTYPEKHQRRDHVRIDINLNIYFKFQDLNKELAEIENMWIAEKKLEMMGGYFKLQTKDVSAGGFRSIANVQIPRETILDCIVEAGGERLKTQAEVVNCMENKNKAFPGGFDIRAKFSNMNKLELDKLVKYIMG